MPRTVVKHSYCGGKRGKESARQHINYICYRSGEDRDKEGRKFFDQKRDDIDVRDVKQTMYDHSDSRGVAMHKLILSPGRQDVDMYEYTREVMYELGREKGMDLTWRAVIHDNTEHIHAHVCLMAKTDSGQRVRLNREDHHRAREIGDDYIYREFGMKRLVEKERDETRDVRDVLKGDEREFKLFIERDLGDVLEDKKVYRGKTDLFEAFDEKDKRKERNPDQDRLDYEKFDRDLKQSLDPDHHMSRPRGRQQMREAQGGLSEFHGDYTWQMEKQRLKELGERFPEMKESFDKELEALKEFADDNRPGQERTMERFLQGIELSESIEEFKHERDNQKGTAEPATQTPDTDERTERPTTPGLTSPEATPTPTEPATERPHNLPDVTTEVIGGKPQRVNEEERERDDDRGIHGA